MEGYLDHLETISHVGMHKKVWTRRLFKLNTTFGVLEFFSNEMQQERKGKLQLGGADVSTADELGELLSDSKTAVEKTRRFVFRITEHGSKKHHYLCADLSDPNAPPSQAYAQASSSRGYLETWLHALRTTIAAQEKPSISSATMGLGELNAQIGSFMNHMHLSGRITGRARANGKSVYEITVKAWILERELDDRSYGHGSIGSGDMSWQILEYSCVWKLAKSTAELQNFDGQLRLLFGPKMQNIALPSSSIGTKLQQFYLHTSASQKEAENLQRMQVYDAYLQALLRLSTFSSFGSDASTMLDTFLDISPHLASFRKLEKESGQSMHLRDRKVVPWKDRERFEVVYKMHLQVIAAQEENGRRAQTSAISRHKEPRGDQHHRHSHHHHQEVSENIVYTDDHQELFAADVALLPTRKVPRGDQKQHHRHHHQQVREDIVYADHQAVDVAPLPAPVKLTAAAEEARPGESVKQRIARIGQRLVIEAFEA